MIGRLTQRMKHHETSGARFRRMIRASLLTAGMFFAVGAANAENIQWFSNTGGINLDSSGQPMDAGFAFELGVFSGGFVPTMDNLASWDAHWVPAQTTPYETASSRFDSVFSVSGNAPPFVAGTAGWIMGKKSTPTGTEKILFRRPSWTWPTASFGSPTGPNWSVNGDENIEVVIGSVNGGGTPFLMQSGVVRDFAQWRELRLAGESLDGPGDDPDGDGVPNLLEFVFDTDPQDAASRVVATGELVDHDGGQHMQLAIPRKRTHLAHLVVQVSSDLVDWDEGPAFTEIVADSPGEWIVRDRTAVSGAPDGRRFIRLKAGLPTE